jgi:hypothetical protein
MSGFGKVLAQRNFGGVAGRQDRSVKRRLGFRDDVVEGYLLDASNSRMQSASVPL